MLAVSVGFIIKLLISDDGQKRQRQLHMVTLLKPPPPPKIKEKPPEPEVKKKKEIKEKKQEEPQPEEIDDSQDDTPPGDELGLDADGSAGSDGFGLKAKKGGRALIGGNSKRLLLKKYSWYTSIIQKELRKLINDYMEKNGGIPDGDLKVIVRISLDGSGNITDYMIKTSCGNAQFESAVASILGLHSFSEPPPRGMPKTLDLRISSKA